MTQRSPFDDDLNRAEELDEDEEDDGTRGIWAAFERETEGRPLVNAAADVESFKERLKRRARERATRPNADAG
ncbi:MAG: hypothetical protein ACRD1H_01360 [Vicinamibacterales bacterium]